MKSPGRITIEIIERLVDDVVTVSEDAIEDAIFLLLEIEKTLAEGAGAAALAAVMAYPEQFSRAGRVATVLSGGNIDMMILSSVLQTGARAPAPVGEAFRRATRRARRARKADRNPRRARQ